MKKRILQIVREMFAGSSKKGIYVITVAKGRIYSSKLLRNAKLLDLGFNYENTNWEGSEMTAANDDPFTGVTDTTKIQVFYN